MSTSVQNQIIFVFFARKHEKILMRFAPTLHFFLYLRIFLHIFNKKCDLSLEYLTKSFWN